jgi:hypothetical protein
VLVSHHQTVFCETAKTPEKTFFLDAVAFSPTWRVFVVKVDLFAPVQSLSFLKFYSDMAAVLAANSVMTYCHLFQEQVRLNVTFPYILLFLIDTVEIICGFRKQKLL